jgi:hypothetical protein
MVAALLGRLEPMAMMEENGLNKAQISLRVLADKAKADAGTPGAIAASPDGVKLLLQTALLHPEPTCRAGAVEVLTACVVSDDAAFLAAALDRGPASLPAALVRLCAEADRRCRPVAASEEAQGSGGAPPAAVDPDLPARRHAVSCLAHLLTHTDQV